MWITSLTRRPDVCCHCHYTAFTIFQTPRKWIGSSVWTQNLNNQYDRVAVCKKWRYNIPVRVTSCQRKLSVGFCSLLCTTVNTNTVSPRLTLPHLAMFRYYVIEIKVLVFRSTLQRFQYNVVCNTCIRHIFEILICVYMFCIQ